MQDARVFRLKKTKNIAFLDDHEIIEGFQITMNLDQTLIERAGYTVLDILSDVGGL